MTTANKSMADGIRIASQITQLFNNYDQLRTTDIQDKIEADLSLQTLRTILNQMDDSDMIMRVNTDGAPSKSGQYWIKPPEQSLLRDTVAWTREIGLLDKPIGDENLEPVEQLAHIMNTADWFDVQNNQRDTSLTQNHLALKNQLEEQRTEDT